MEDHANHSRHLGRSVSQPESRPSTSIHHSRRFDGRQSTLPFLPLPPLTLSESWVELSSQPSSSSLSSVDNEIVTTGLHVGSPFQRRRRLHASARSHPPHQQTALHVAGGGASSQDEEDESDSDDDDDHQLMTSSAENIHSSEKEASDDAVGDESDDGDNATTLGRRTSDAPPVFRPHPNAFTHPPAGLGQRSYSTSSAEQPHPHSSFRRSSYPHRPHARGQRAGAPTFMSPSLREDNDAALRASLTTLLSCAAAARGLPKSKEETDAQRTTRTGVAPSNQPMELRLMPESELASDNEKQAEAGPATTTRRRRSSPSRSGAVSPKSKRAESASRASRAAAAAAAKKKRAAAGAAAAVHPDEAALISPTLLSWVVSAGVVVLVSVVGFGAGYVIGREVGREEAREALAASIGGGVNDTTSAGGDVIRSSVGLRKLRWTSVGRSIVAQA